MSELAGRKIFVTGATGFVGRRVVHMLQSQGAKVVGASRSKAGRAWLGQQGVDARPVDISNPDQMRQALADCDNLIHLAYDIRASGASNLTAFQTVLNAAQVRGLQRMVHVSSVVVYDDWPMRDLTENSPVTVGGSGYRRAKIAMEQAALAQQKLPVTILQPTLVYGPGSSLWTTRLAKALLAGGVVLPSDAGTAHLVYVDDVARAVAAGLSCNTPSSDRYLISGPGDATWPDYLGGLAQVLQTPLPQVETANALVERAGPRPDPNAPPAAPSLAARVSAVGRRTLGHERFESWVSAVTGRKGSQAPPLYPDHVLLDLYRTRASISNAKAAWELGHTPEFDLARGLAATTDFLKDLREKG